MYSLILEKFQYCIFEIYPNPAVSGTTITGCYPSQFISSFLSQQTVDTALPAFAPLVCPVGYSQITTNSAGYLACCPSGFSLALQTTSSVFTRPAYGGTCHTPISTVLVRAYGNANPTATSTGAAPSEGAQAYALPIEGFAAVVTTSSSPSTSAAPAITHTASASSTPAPRHSHTRAIIGGITGGIAVLAILSGLLVRPPALKTKTSPTTS